MTFYKTLFVSLIAIVLATFAGQGLAHAQTANSGGSIIPAPSMCTSISENIHYGASDTASDNAVTNLQNFLVSQGFFDSANLGTGHFGPVTSRAVIKFQAAHGIPTTGFVGPLTRAAIQSIGCGSTTPPVTTTAPVTLYSITPASGDSNTSVSITGFGFTNSNTVLFNGNVAARNLPISSSIAIACTTNPSCHGGINQTINFSVPTSLSPNCPPNAMCAMFMQLVTPGQYTVTVENSNGTISNPVTFTVTGTNPTTVIPQTVQAPTITTINAPQNIHRFIANTWTMKFASNSTDNLQYSISWGDGGQDTGSLGSTLTSANFAHTYLSAGTYTARFTVTNSSGVSATATSVNVVNY